MQKVPPLDNTGDLDLDTKFKSKIWNEEKSINAFPIPDEQIQHHQHEILSLLNTFYSSIPRCNADDMMKILQSDPTFYDVARESIQKCMQTSAFHAHNLPFNTLEFDASLVPQEVKDMLCKYDASKKNDTFVCISHKPTQEFIFYNVPEQLALGNTFCPTIDTLIKEASDQNLSDTHLVYWLNEHTH